MISLLGNQLIIRTFDLQCNYGIKKYRNRCTNSQIQLGSYDDQPVVKDEQFCHIDGIFPMNGFFSLGGFSFWLCKTLT